MMETQSSLDEALRHRSMVVGTSRMRKVVVMGAAYSGLTLGT